MPEICGVATWGDTSTQFGYVKEALVWDDGVRGKIILWYLQPLRQLGLVPTFYQASELSIRCPEVGQGHSQEIKANSMIIYLLTLKKTIHSSALCRIRWGNWGCEQIKSVKIFNECNYWIISHTVLLLQSIPVPSEILQYCIAFSHSCNHINVP